MDVDTISEWYIINEIDNGNIVILAWQLWGIYHSVLITGYNKAENKFTVIDPLKWYQEKWDFRETINFSKTQIWSRALSIWKNNLNDLKEDLKWAYIEYNSLHKRLHWDKKRIIWLDQLESNDYRNFGSKSYKLSILKKYWYNVEDGVVLNSDILSKIESWTVSDAECQSIVDDIHNALWEDLIVRSNFVWEDGTQNSFAWVFNSYLSIHPKDLIENIKKVISSISNKELYNNKDLKPWVLIQKMVYWDYSWVAFSKNPIGGEWMIIEIVKWLNEGMVDGSKQPISIKVTEDTIDYSEEIELDSWVIDKLIDTIKNIKKIFNQDVDIEYTIKDNNIYILQVRPITSIVMTNNKVILTNVWVDCQTIAPGDFSWEIVYIEKKEDINKINKKCVVVCNSLHTELLSKSQFLEGVIGEKWWILCHFAIIGRELNIPVVSNATWIIDKLMNTAYISCKKVDDRIDFI